MNTKRFLALLMTLAISLSIFVLPVAAEEACTHNHEEVEIIFVDENIPEELKQKATDYLLHEDKANDGATTYGIICDLLGHKIETTQAYKTTHKASSTAPRCLKRLYKYEACTRCDYQTSTIISSQFISCCA